MSGPDPIDPYDEAEEKIREMYAELVRLRVLATRWYLADGTFETLPEEEVIRRRKEAAKTLARCGDVEGMAKELFWHRWQIKWEDAHRPSFQHDQALSDARALSAFLEGRE